MSKELMRILWTANIVLPVVAEALGQRSTAFGGWLTTTTSHLARADDVRVGVAMRGPVGKFTRIDHEGVTYFAIPQQRKNGYDVNQADCDRVLAEFAPDILHAEGTEMSYTHRFLKSWAGPKVISMQGVINAYAPYQLGRLPVVSMLSPIRPRRMAVALALLTNERVRFRPRLFDEQESISSVGHIIGRTLWDRAQAAWLNPRASYYHCPRILREPFYCSRWNPGTYESRSIFIGNASSPIKGAHFALHALAILLKHFPDVKLYISGPHPRSVRRFSLGHLFGYQVYLMDLIEELGLFDHVIFTGELQSSEMAARMRQSHVYLLPSLIENSPNTLAEAMIMGVPAVASCVGGVPSMACDEKEALLYRAEDPAMLAFQIRRLFDDETLCIRLSQAARSRALLTHDPEKITATLLNIYRTIVNNR